MVLFLGREEKVKDFWSGVVERKGG